MGGSYHIYKIMYINVYIKIYVYIKYIIYVCIYIILQLIVNDSSVVTAFTMHFNLNF